MTGFRRMQEGGFRSLDTPCGWQGGFADAARQKAARDRTGRRALKKLAHYAADAQDYRTLAEALGLDLSLLKDGESG